MPRREAAKDFRESVVNVMDTSSKEAWKLPSRVLSKEKTSLKMIDLRRLPDVFKFEILHNLWDLKKDSCESIVKMVLHDCNRKQMCSLKLREWVDGKVEVVGKAVRQISYIIIFWLKTNTVAILFLIKRSLVYVYCRYFKTQDYNARLITKLRGGKESLVNEVLKDLAFTKLYSMDSKISTSWTLVVFQLMTQVGAPNKEIHC
ncbi:hypothetical protein M9H77_32071 [Catharanthus roseus]|uniref:Uncharacterized protein n=1 Tax=Catharanthus roseus TaxID=4058 RepID=A0ACC0A3X9_CATRO|nr:hypothetical protein M9H77_32071 [Catharanthus roseus]